MMEGKSADYYLESKSSMKNKHNIIQQKNNVTSDRIELVHGGDDYFNRLLHVISNAQSEIHLQTYIFENDATGIAVAHELKKAALRNVKIYVLLDGYGSSKLPIQFIKELIINGVNIRFFSPLYFVDLFYLGRRLHHKIVIVDGHISLIGGINISDQYRGTATKAAWLDYAVQIKSIEIAEYLQHLCQEIYFKKKRTQHKKLKTNFFTVDGINVRILQNDWLKRQNEVSNSYFKIIRNTKKEIIIVGSYFLPGQKLFNTLKKASENKVNIKLILAGISDVPFTRRATCYLYASLLKNKIELYEWKNSILHGKAAVADGEWTTIGSFNLNHLSSYGSLELNVEINSKPFSEKLATHLHQVIAQSEKITQETLITRNGIWNNFINWLAYQLIRFAMILITYFPFKQFDKVSK